jgi:CheY-like chemotaxis protein
VQRWHQSTRIGLRLCSPDLGYQVAQNIRSAAWGETMRLVAVTGWGREDDRQRAFAAGFNHHLTKPITAEALESLLDSLSESLPARQQ